MSQVNSKRKFSSDDEDEIMKNIPAAKRLNLPEVAVKGPKTAHECCQDLCSISFDDHKKFASNQDVRVFAGDRGSARPNTSSRDVGSTSVESRDR